MHFLLKLYKDYKDCSFSLHLAAVDCQTLCGSITKQVYVSVQTEKQASSKFWFFQIMCVVTHVKYNTHTCINTKKYKGTYKRYVCPAYIHYTPWCVFL